ncbi:MAG TPA: hypothetical protein VGD23_09800 [Sphingomicrobium sp.]
MSSAAPQRRSIVDWFFFDWHQPAALGAVRFYFGLGLAIYLFFQFDQVLRVDPFGAHFNFTRPIWYFWLLGIDTNVPWISFLAMPLLIAACLLFALGKWTKPAIIAIFIGIFYLKGVRDSFSGDVHHREIPIFAILILFLFSKCDRMFGIDARKKNLPPIEAWESSWPLRAMQVYIAMFYFWALMAKIRLSGLDWFTGGGRIQEVLISRALRDGFTPTGEVANMSLGWAMAQQPDLVWFCGALVFAFELLFPLILLVRDWRLKLLALIGATCFHLANYVLMNVQFFLYPFVFVAFFNMNIFHEWLMGRLRLRKAAPATAG